jgi:hypothetical protein
MTEALFETVLEATGQAFLAAEAQIVAESAVAGPVLAAKAQEAAGFERLVADLLLRRIEGDEELQGALDLLDEIERETAPLETGAPPPEWAAGELFRRFGDRVAPLLAVYAVKLQEVWPSWRTVASIVYLSRLPTDASAVGLVELIATTPFRPYRQMAADGLAELDDGEALALIEDRLLDETTGEAGREALERAAESIRERNV